MKEENFIIIIICKPTKNEPFLCNGQWSMMSRREIGIWVNHAQAWPMQGPPAALLKRATSGQRPRASRATPAGLAWQYLDRKYLFFDQALPMRRAGMAHPWPTSGPPVAYPWLTRGPPGPCRNVPPRQRGIPCYMGARSARSA